MTDYRAQTLDGIREHMRDSLLLRRGNGEKQTGIPRTDADDLAERPCPVIFGSGGNAREFLLYPKPHLEADEWRMAALSVINHARPLLMQELGAGDPMEMARSGEAIMGLLNLFVAGTIPAIAELVFDWEPTLDRDLILNELGATDAQIGAAFLACLQLAFPFVETLRGVTRLIQGSQAATAKTPPETPSGPPAS